MGTTEMHVYYDVTCGKEKNNYISDGHGAEPLIRTNRHLLDVNYLPKTGMDTMVNAALDNVIEIIN